MVCDPSEAPIGCRAPPTGSLRMTNPSVLLELAGKNHGVAADAAGLSSATPTEPVPVSAVPVSNPNADATPSHYCVACAARWIRWPDDTWSLLSPTCGPCCDNVSMDKAPIIPFQADGTIRGQDYDRARAAYRASEWQGQVSRYQGISCALCGEVFERHAHDWRCSRLVVPRFKFPASAVAAQPSPASTPTPESI